MTETSPTEPRPVLEAPWTPEQVQALNDYQNEGWMHPFSCPRGHGNLVATVEGWICRPPACDYTQNWAHPFMADPEVAAQAKRLLR